MSMLLCVDVCVGSILLDELAARLYVVTHQHREDLVSLSGILNSYLLQQAVLRIHGGLPELFWVHLTKTFVALCVECCSVLVASDVLVDEGLTLLLGIAVLRELLEGTLIKRWGSDVEVATLNDLWHEAIEERHDERVDVRTIDVGIGHDDNLVVTQLVDIGLAIALAINAEAYTNGLDDVHDRLSLEDTVPLNLLDVQNLTTQRQDSLEVTVTALLGRATSGVTLDEEYLTNLGVFL